jgi:hypothetical protein
LSRKFIFKKLKDGAIQIFGGSIAAHEVDTDAEGMRNHFL